jgi:hypothetical protein
MSKSSAFAVIAAAFAIAGPAAASPAYHLGKYADVPTGNAGLQYAADRAHYLTYTGSVEQTPNAGVRYLTYTGNTEQRSKSGAPQGMTFQEWKADLIRGAALNSRYGLGASNAAELRGRAMNKAYGNAWTKMPAQQFAALVNMFGTDVTQYSPQQLHALLAQRSASSGSGFGFGDAGIGAGAALGLVLLAAAVRHLRRTPKLATA